MYTTSAAALFPLPTTPEVALSRHELHLSSFMTTVLWKPFRSSDQRFSRLRRNLQGSRGILPAPESSHAIRVAIDEALKCKETGEEKDHCIRSHRNGLFRHGCLKNSTTAKWTIIFPPTDADLETSFPQSFPRLINKRYQAKDLPCKTHGRFFLTKEGSGGNSVTPVIFCCPNSKDYLATTVVSINAFYFRNNLIAVGNKVGMCTLGIAICRVKVYEGTAGNNDLCGTGLAVGVIAVELINSFALRHRDTSYELKKPALDDCGAPC